MNTYDFDKTIFNPDSSYKFFLFSLRRHPGAVLRTLPKTAIFGIAYAMGSIDTKILKQQVFSFLRHLRDVDGEVEAFWQENFGRIESWYLKQKQPDDVIISASPEFLLRPACDRLGVSLLGTPMDRHSGEIMGLNCHDSEKVRRFYEKYPGARTENFYSDSLSDTPMALIADKAWLVNLQDIRPWPDKEDK